MAREWAGYSGFQRHENSYRYEAITIISKLKTTASLLHLVQFTSFSLLSSFPRGSLSPSLQNSWRNSLMRLYDVWWADGYYLFDTSVEEFATHWVTAARSVITKAGEVDYFVCITLSFIIIFALQKGECAMLFNKSWDLRAIWCGEHEIVA